MEPIELIVSDAEKKDLNEDNDAVYLDHADISPDFKRNFTDARKAIEDGDMPKLKAAVQAMQEEGKISREECLNVVVKVPGPKRDPHKKLPMTLLAFAGYHARREMIDFLIDNHAKLEVKNIFVGTPLLQMLCYARIRDHPQHIDKETVKFFVNHKDVVLSRILNTGYIRKSTALDACLFLGRLDIIKELLIPKGFDPLEGGNPAMKPIFVEYVHYPSNEFLKWLFKEHFTGPEIPRFIARVNDARIKTHTANKIYGKNPLHALLLCDSGEVVDALRSLRPDILNEEDPFGKTALHIAAEKGDTQNLKILLERGADMKKQDHFSMTPLMLATKNEHTKAVEILMEAMERPSTHTTKVAKEKLGPMVMWAWALQNSYATYFEAMHKEMEREELLLEPLDNDGNTIAHLAAESGNTVIFKSIIPKVQAPNVYEILLEGKRNRKGLTPLQVAIVKGNVRILQTLQEQRAERKKIADKGYSIERQGDSVEENELNKLWKDQSQKLMLFACEHGTVDVVQYFVTELVSPKFGLKKEKKDKDSRDENPLYYAAKAGKHETVAYLLSINGVSPDSDTPSKAPILIASRNGHSKCIIHLIEKGADLSVRSECGFNYLMEAIKAGHENAAKAVILHLQSEENDNKWEQTMKVFDENTKEHTPMRMLIEHMPDVANLAMKRCVQEKEKDPPPGRVNLDASKQKCCEYDFSLIEDYTEKGAVPSWRPQPYSPSSHPLAYLVKHERLKLLQHPLMSLYIARKWWKEAFPFFVLYILLYTIFLVFLTSFALRIPRPSPGNEFCPSNSSSVSYTQLNINDGDCKGPNGSDKAAFPTLAVLLILQSIAFLGFEVLFRYMMREYSETFYYWFELVVRVGVFLLTIIFVSGFGHDCWCTPPWQWQIGALAVFLAYFNAVLLLKGLPFLGVYISMLLKIIATFIFLIYLPILLILAFAFPFYMLFVRDAAAVLGDAGILVGFSTPAHSLAKTMMQTAGELDFEALFNEGDLLYSPMAYILFISFVVIMPILFNNMLTGLAVGTADEDKKNAEFTNIQLQVQYILALENFRFIRRRGYRMREECPENVSRLQSKWDWLRGIDYDSQKAKLEELDKDTDEKSREKVTKMMSVVGNIQERIPALERSHRELQQSLEHVMKALKEINSKI